MALSWGAAVLQRFQQSSSHQVPALASVVSVRWRVRRKREWLIRDQKDTSWMEPMLEYRQEKATHQEKDPEPSPLHVVYRVEALKGRPWWEKKTMQHLQLDGPRNTPVIHKNNPNTNRKLKIVKHLIKIQPLKFPYGFPDDPQDYKHTILKSSGELIVKKTLNLASIDESREDAEEKQKWQLDLETIQRELKRKLLTYTVQKEYFPTKYNFTRNQDGKEYRYNFNKPKKD